jgi:hypothetical protein
MRIAGLVMLAAGAILVFAVNAQVPGINLWLAGLILIVAGLIGLIAPSGAAAWVRRRVLTRGAAPGPDLADPATDEADDTGYPAYLLQDPAVLAAEVLNGVRAGRAGTAAGAGSRGSPGIHSDDRGWP